MKKLFYKQCSFVQCIKMEINDFQNFNFYLKRLSKIFFIRQPDTIYDRIACSLIISLSYLRNTHCLRFLLSFIYALGSVTNHLKKLLTILSVCYLCPPFFKNKRAFYISALKKFLKYSKINFKIFQKYIFVVTVCTFWE